MTRQTRKTNCRDEGAALLWNVDKPYRLQDKTEQWDEVASRHRCLSETWCRDCRSLIHRLDVCCIGNDQVKCVLGRGTARNSSQLSDRYQVM